MSLTGSRIGPYEIVSPLGAGGMGEVYRARDTKLGREVAIKILPGSFASDSERLARFEREARVLASLSHANIATIYGLEQSDGVQAIVMELVEGETLAERLGSRDSGLGIRDSLAFARQIADALDAAHERGIVHRDLKPANIIITPDGAVKVLDFGLAKPQAGGAGQAGWAGSDDGLTNSPTVIGPTLDGVLLGTAPYMSPEQARGKAVDKRTDIWAFGCVLYEMLTGHRAFGAETTTDVLAAIVEHDPDWSQLPRTTPPQVTRLLKRCLEKDAKRRLRDVADVRIDLDDAALWQPLPTAAVERSSRRKRTLWIAFAAMSAAIVGVVVWNARPMPGAAPPRITRAIRLTDTPVQEFGPAISPDGKWVAYYSDVRGVPDVWVKFVDSGATSNLTALLDLELQVRASIGGVDISPDGALIAFTARQKSETTPAFSTWVISAPLGGQARKLLTGLQGMRWSPDGRQLVAMRPGATLGDSLVIADADGGRQRTIVPLTGGRHAHWPAWSRDGKSIYFICTFMTGQDEPTELCRVPAEGGAVETAVTTVRRAMYPAPMPDGSLIFAANPLTIDLGLWWRPAKGGEPLPLTSGVGEYAETYISADGRRAAATLVEVRQSLVEVPVRAGSEPRRVTDGYTGDLYPHFDAGGQRLTFSSSRSGNRGLWLARPDGTEAKPLTSGAAIDDRPAFSPRGDQIAFVSGRSGRQGIWVVSTDGGPPRLIGEAVVLDTLTWSPDGKQILFSTPGDRLAKLVTMSVEDGRIEPFSAPAPGHSPSWSQATNRIAYLELEEATSSRPSRTTLAVIAGGEHRTYANTTSLQGFANGFTAWSPDGRRVAAVAVQANTRVTIWIFDPDAREPFHRLVELPVTVRVRGIAWTPDGSSLLVAEQESKSDIVLFDMTNPIK